MHFTFTNTLRKPKITNTDFAKDRCRIRINCEIFRTCPDRPWGPPSLLYNGYRVFPAGKERPGRDADPSPLLVPWSRKGRAIPLLPLWAVRPVQSLSACTRVHFTFTNKLREPKITNTDFANHRYRIRTNCFIVAMRMRNLTDQQTRRLGVPKKFFRHRDISFKNRTFPGRMGSPVCKHHLRTPVDCIWC